MTVPLLGGVRGGFRDAIRAQSSGSSLLGERAVVLAQSVFGKWFPGSTGDPPVPSGDPPDGTETKIRGNENGLFGTWLIAVPVGGSPTGAGESPAPPIFKTRSHLNSMRGPIQRAESGHLSL